MSNLLKGFTTKQAEERVIDYNELINNKIESFKQKLEQEKIEADGFVDGIQADVVKELVEDGDLNEENFDPLSLLVSDETQEPEIDESVTSLAGEIIEDANNRASEIMEKAQADAEAIKASAYEKGMDEGRARGYSEGVAKAEEEYQILINNANEELARLQDEYTARYNSMENEIVSVLLELFEKVTYTVSDDNKEIILHLINNVMNNVEASGDFLIRVSKDDYPFVVENQGRLYCAASKDVNISVVEDPSMVKNQCMIETDGGIFDCSLDIQLEQLMKDIKLLSCI